MMNPYLPVKATIAEIREETGGARPIKTFRVVLQNGYEFNQKPGQCAMVGILRVGESMISISSSPTQKGYLEFSIMKLGKVTSALHAYEAGETITIRGQISPGLSSSNVAVSSSQSA